METVFYSNTTVTDNTEAEKIFLSPGEKKIRTDYKGEEKPSPGDPKNVYFSKKPYYEFIQNVVYQFDQTRCEPPYNDYFEEVKSIRYGNKNCFDLGNFSYMDPVTELPEVLKCYTGVIPFTCPELT